MPTLHVHNRPTLFLYWLRSSTCTNFNGSNYYLTGGICPSVNKIVKRMDGCNVLPQETQQ